MPTGLRVALTCGTIPLLLGIFALADGRILDPGNPVLGAFLVLGVSFPIHVAGLMGLASFWNSKTLDSDVRKRWRVSSRWALIILVANYPVALVLLLVQFMKGTEALGGL